MKLNFDKFMGIAPRMAEHLLPEGAGVTAENCRLSGGELAPWRQMSEIQDPAGGSVYPPYQGLYLYRGSQQRGWKPPSSTPFWCTWAGTVNAVPSPIANDSHDRLYFTGDGVPKVTASDIIDSGSGDYPQVSHYIGVPTPGAKPLLTKSGSATSTDPTTAITRSCVYTFVNEYGEEGPPSPVSDEIEVYPGEQWDIAGLSTSYSANYRGIDKQRIYLTNTGTTGTEFQLVEEVDPPAAAATSVLHSFTAFGEVLPTEGWIPPPEAMEGLVMLPWGSMAGFAPNDPLGGSGNTVYLSVPYQPHAYPAEYAFSVAEQIVGLAVFGNSLLVLTDGLPTLATGVDPVSMSFDRLEHGYPCAAKRGIVTFKGQIIYPTAEGLVTVAPTGAQLLTENLFTEREWASYYPAGIVAGEYAGFYIGFFDDLYAEEGEYGFRHSTQGEGRGGFVFNLRTGQFTTLPSTLEASAFHSYTDLGVEVLALNSLEDSTNNIPASTVIRQWDGDPDSFYTYTWKSRPVFTSFPMNFAAMRVYAASYPVTAKVYADGTLIHTETVADEEGFRLPSEEAVRRWQVEIIGTAEVYQVFIADSMEELDRTVGA